jgi:dTDP-4-dehydrorhamnose 3,5-epimerase-like enzyme
MELITKDLKEPKLIKIQSISDDRGYLVPFTDYIDDEYFKRAYVVGDYGKGVIRGLHYHKEEAKVFIIGNGAAKFITMQLPMDIAERNNDEEIKAYLALHPEALKTHVMSSRHHAVLVVPALFANGWVSLEDNTILFSLGSIRWEQAMHDDIRINPYVIGEEKWQVIGR